MELGPIGTALVTPFNEQGSIDYELTKALIEHVLATGTTALIINGTTGESPTLSKQEKEQMLRFALDIVDGRVPVLAGTGSNNTQESIEMTLLAEEIGVDGVMLVSPYYNKPNDHGVIAHFKAIASATTLPILLYNIPGRSMINMPVEVVVELSHVDNIFGIKEASGDLNQMASILAKAAHGFQVYSGDDGLTLPLLAIGGSGVISVASHVLGSEMQEMITTFQQGKVQRAAQMHRTLLPAFQLLFSEPNPIALKYELNRRGYEVGSVRLPLVPMTVDTESVNTFKKGWSQFERQRSHLFTNQTSTLKVASY